MNILVYGDSNSWGYLDDGTGLRAPERWPQVMARTLRSDVCLSEACLPGRTTAIDDTEMGAFVNGRTHLLPTLLSHQPIDLVIIMLGTNDFKARFNRSVGDIAQSLFDLANIVRDAGAGRGPWRDGSRPDVCIIAPPVLGRRADDPTWDRCEEWLNGRDKSLALPTVLRAGCEALRLLFVDANDSVQSSELDPIHWSEESHQRFGQYMAHTLKPILDKVSQRDGQT